MGTRAGFCRAAAVVLIGLAGACARQPEVRTGSGSAGFTAARLTAGKLAVGGAVLADGVVLEGPAATGGGDDWASQVYGRFLAGLPSVSSLPLPMVRDLAGDDLLEAMQDEYADERRVAPAHLATFRSRVPDARHLVLVRIDKDEIVYRTRDVKEGVVDDRDARPWNEGSLPDQPFASPARRARRVTVCAMDIIDLPSGSTVWSARAERHREIIVEHYSPTRAGDLKVKKPASEGAEPVIATPEPDLEGLEIEGLLSDCLEALVENLASGNPAAGEGS